MKKYRYIIWDWNGTLLDDVYAAMTSVNDMLTRRGKETIDIDLYRDCIGVPIIRFYERLFDLEKENYGDILKEYNEGYLAHLEECGLSEGVAELLEYYRTEGAIQLIVSSSNNEQLIANVRKYGVSECFDAVLGATDYLAESKIERARDYLEKHGTGDALVIGDLIHDKEMADELGADCVLLTSGHEKRERLFSSGARIIDSLYELL